MVWEFVGVRGCVATDTGHSLVTLLSLSTLIKDRSLLKVSWASHRFIILSTYLCMGAWKTCCSLVMDPALSGSTVRVVFGLGGPCLEYQFGRGPRHLGQESDGLVLLVPRLQAGYVFSGYPAGALIRESPGNPVWLVSCLAP